MKITIFGLTISSSWGNGHATPYRAIVRALKRLGHEVVFYEKDVPYYAKRRDFASAEFCELVLYSGWASVRTRALADVRESDVVVNASYCPDGKQICDEVLETDGPLKVFYDLDTPVTVAALAAGMCDYLRSDQIPEIDLYLSFTGGMTLHELRTKWHAKKALPLYGCVDPEVHRRVEVPEQYRCLMSYMGTYAADRQAKLDTLFLEPVRRRPEDVFVLAGSMYPAHWQWPSNLRRFEHVGPGDHPALYSSSRFTLNLTRDSMAVSGYCPSGRFFEAAACGTPIISDWFEGLDTFFTPGEEIFIAKNSDDVMSALALSDDEVALVAARARERTLAEHTGERRARELLSYLEAAFAGKRVSAEVGR
ncbi:MAG TPA: glycosyltransferase [Terriglobales bacterium]|nr:glycosyltransferase [Terriglobales bacterium]